jgi:hypothetical protein
VLSLLPATARAEGPDPVWSLGSGLGYLGYSGAAGLGSIQGYNYYLQVPSAPQPQVGLERRISAATSLFFDLSGGVSSGSGSTAGLGNYNSVATSSSSWSAGALIGVRQALTDPGAVVGVSVFGGLTLGYAATKAEVVSQDGAGVQTTTRPSAHQLGFGLGGGLSAEKTLTERLTLRLVTRLVSAGYTRSAYHSNDVDPWIEGSGFSAQLGFDPAVELRLAF